MWIITGTLAICHRINGKGGEGIKGERSGKQTNSSWKRIIGEKKREEIFQRNLIFALMSKK